MMTAIGGTRHELPPRFGPDSRLSHQLGDGVAADDLPADQQDAVDARAPVEFPILAMRDSNLFQQLFAADLSRRRLSALPAIKPAAAHFQDSAHRVHRPESAMVLDELELHGCSLAK